MKFKYALVGLAALALATTQAQEKAETNRTIEIVEKNGERRVTVTTETNGKKTVEVMEGAKADEFMENELSHRDERGEREERAARAYNYNYNYNHGPRGHAWVYSWPDDDDMHELHAELRELEMEINHRMAEFERMLDSREFEDSVRNLEKRIRYEIEIETDENEKEGAAEDEAPNNEPAEEEKKL